MDDVQPASLLVHTTLILAMVAGMTVEIDAADGEPAAWQNLTTVAEVVDHAPARVDALLAALDLERPALAPVAGAVAEGDRVAACQALLAHYRDGDAGAWLRDQAPAAPIDESTLARAEEVLGDIYHGFGDQGPMPRRRDGHLDWTHLGPNEDRQFANRVNRHGYLNQLLRAYQATDEVRFVERLDQDLRDWLIAADGDPKPEGFGHGPLEAALRMPVWTRVFYALQDEQRFRPATRLLMLVALPAHAEYLRKSVRRGHNFATMQMNGLGTIGLAFPEFKDAEGWWTFARDVMAEEVDQQVYPDGAQVELTYHYHMVALGRFDDLLETAAAAGEAVEGDYAKNVEAMYDYAARAMRPDGTGPINGDSEVLSHAPKLLEAAERFERPDWRYIATAGEAGERPADPPSRFMPWAGQLVSRSGWDADAHWSFFDVGPYGHGGHGHPDRLHLSVMAHGRHLLVDTGRFAYQGRIARKFRRPYMWHTRSHNAILIDGKSQAEGPKTADRPIGTNRYAIADDHDWAVGEMRHWRGLAGEATHRRAVHYQRGGYWLVVDQIESDRPRRIQPLWHFHPECSVELVDGGVCTTDPTVGNLRIVPVGELPWDLRLARGEESPALMGWYSPNYNQVVPTTVAIADASIEAGTTTFAWLLVPAAGAVPPATAELVEVRDEGVTVRVQIGDGPGVEVAVPLRPDHGSGDP